VALHKQILEEAALVVAAVLLLGLSVVLAVVLEDM
jgi:hypothetical protein